MVGGSGDGNGGSPFSKVKLQCGLASMTRQGLVSSFDFQPRHHLCSTLLLLQTSTSPLSFAYPQIDIMGGGSEPLDRKHGQ